MIQAILRDWKFLGNSDVVEFNEQKMDIVVAGKHRLSNGKGLRGFLHGAFSLGLMRYCRANPTSLTPDSLCSIRLSQVIVKAGLIKPKMKPRQRWQAGDSGDNLAKWTKDEQIVLIENKEPTESARQLAHYVHFFGAKSTQGRKGFFPPRPS